MRSRLRLFELEIQQACYFYSPAILLKLMYWHVLSPHLILPVKTRIIFKSLREVLPGMLSETTAVVKTRPIEVLLNNKVLLLRLGEFN